MQANIKISQKIQSKINVMFRNIFTIGCFGLVSQLYADNTVILNHEQLQQTQSEIMKQGNDAIAKAQPTQKELSTIKLKQLELSSTESEIQQANEVFKHIQPLNIKLPTGEKYRLYSESIVSDAKQYTDSFSNHTPIDINQTISDYNAMLKNSKSNLGQSKLLIFISSSMPKKTIINLMAQSSSTGAVFIVRGVMNGSYVKTYKYFYGLKGDNTVGIMINPTLFKALAIDSVPTFALYKSSQDLMKTACNVSPTYVKVSGDVPVQYALTQLQNSKITELSQIATNELHVLENDNFYNKRK